MFKKIIFALFIMVMGVQTISAEEGHKDPSLQLTGFAPQTKDQTKRYNLSRDQFRLYVLGIQKPSIIPSNSFWKNEWQAYAASARQQIVLLVRAATGETLSETDAINRFFAESVEQKVAENVRSTGISYNKATGKVVGVGWTVTRPPYKTVDGGERMLVFTAKMGTVKFSLVCGNSFEFEPKDQPPVVIKPEPKPEKVPVFCNETQKIPVFCDQQGTGNSSGIIATTVKSGGAPPQSGAGKIETTVPVKQYTTSTGKVLVPGR